MHSTLAHIGFHVRNSLWAQIDGFVSAGFGHTRISTTTNVLMFNIQYVFCHKYK